MNHNPVRTRVAPSPTGWLHIGTARAALFNYLFARQYGGQFILRIDNTDTDRSKDEYIQNIIESLDWLGLNPDETYKQSERGILYRDKLQYLLETNKAYVSQEAVIKEGDRDSVIRFRNPGTIITFDDTIHGPITFDTKELGDFIIAKDLDTPLYHFASVVDDIDLAISHVIRGEDHISNTPRQILMLEALGGTRPIYTHIPLILASDRSKLSKRHGAVAVTEYRNQGYLPEAFINFIALLGWSPQASTKRVVGTNEEIFTIKELIERFDTEALQRSSAVFNIEKLDWLNKEYLKRIPLEQVQNRILEKIPTGRLSDHQSKSLAKVLFDRISTFNEIEKIFKSGEFDFLFTNPQPTKELLKTTEHISGLIELLQQIPDKDFTSLIIKETIWNFATEKGRGDVLWPMRVALTGQEKSIDPFTAAELLGKEETLSRLTAALNRITV